MSLSLLQAHTNTLAPHPLSPAFAVTATKLYNELRNSRDNHDSRPPRNFETSYVVKLHRTTLLASPQAVFSFHHPAPRGPNHTNSRYMKLSFQIDPELGATCMHGFGGYFDTVLYDDVMLSTHPDWHTPGMFSWFPIFFPLKEPVKVPRAGRVTLHVWRCVTGVKVWYEWVVTEPSVGQMHNVCGRGHAVGL